MDTNSNGLVVSKAVTKFVVGAGATRIAHDIIRQNTTPSGGKYDTVVRYAGALAIGAVVSKASSRWATDFIDDLVSTYNDLTGQKTPDPEADTK